MTPPSVNWPKEVYEPVELHLDNVEEVLFEAGTSRRERRAILDELQGQINEMLAERFGAEATVEQVQRLVQELDPPEKYAGSIVPRARRIKRAEPRLSPWAIAGLGSALCPLVFFGLALLLTDMFGSVFYLSVLVAVAGTPYCGVRALLQIERQPARFYGKGLAITLFVLPTLAACNALVYATAAGMLGETGLMLLTLAAYVILNVLALHALVRLVKWFAAATARTPGRRFATGVSASTA